MFHLVANRCRHGIEGISELGFIESFLTSRNVKTEVKGLSSENGFLMASMSIVQPKPLIKAWKINLSSVVVIVFLAQLLAFTVTRRHRPWLDNGGTFCNRSCENSCIYGRCEC